MIETKKQQIIDDSWRIHYEIEQAYLAHQAVTGDIDWPEKQRLLLADMALHLLQTALNKGELNSDKLRNNVYSILTIVDPFLPDAKLAQAKENIF